MRIFVVEKGNGESPWDDVRKKPLGTSHDVAPEAQFKKVMATKVVKIADIAAEIEKINMKSAWSKGVKAWALSALEKYWLTPEDSFQSAGELEKALLNGAHDMRHFCEGGNSIIYNQDIAELFCTPSELRKTAGGRKDPNARETWMDLQCRAAFQAWGLIADTFMGLSNR